MEHQKYAKLLRTAAPLAALLLAALRVVIWKSAIDDSGLLPRDSKLLTVTVLTAACLFAGLWALCLRLNRLPGTEACFRGGPVLTALRLAGGALVLLGSLLSVLKPAPDAGAVESAILLAGVVSGLLLCWLALAPKRGPRFVWARLLIALYTGAALILRFREWSHDPLVIHILPMLLAWTCCMVETTLLAGFSLGAGHRRSGVLFGLAAAVFTCMCLPDCLLSSRTGITALLPLLGLALCCAAAALDLLRDEVQAELPPAEPAPEPAPAEQSGDPEREKPYI